MNKKHHESFLELKNISVHYGGVKALSGVDVSFYSGEIVTLIGPNGAGKSTLLKSIFGLAPHATGKLLLRGKGEKPVPHKMVRSGIAFVPQGRRVFSSLTVEENLEIGGTVFGSKRECATRMEEVMNLFPVLKEKASSLSGTLSGGQQQMLALARGLMTNPSVLLLDEPSLGLAPKIVKEIFAKIKEINEKRGTTIVIVEHNLASLFHIVHRVVVLDKGMVVYDGDVKKLQSSNLLERVFLGKA